MIYKYHCIKGKPIIAFLDENFYIFRKHDHNHPSLRETICSAESILTMMVEYEELIVYFESDYSGVDGQKLMLKLLANYWLECYIAYLFVKGYKFSTFEEALKMLDRVNVFKLLNIDVILKYHTVEPI